MKIHECHRCNFMCQIPIFMCQTPIFMLMQSVIHHLLKSSVGATAQRMSVTYLNFQLGPCTAPPWLLVWTHLLLLFPTACLYGQPLFVYKQNCLDSAYFSLSPYHTPFPSFCLDIFKTLVPGFAHRNWVKWANSGNFYLVKLQCWFWNQVNSLA